MQRYSITTTTLLVASILALTPALASANDEVSPAKDREEFTAKVFDLADLRYTNGLRLVFTYDESAAEFGLLQEGQSDDTTPIIIDPESLLTEYLEVTPSSVVVPRLLLAEPPEGSVLPAELASRRITEDLVFADQLALPGNAPTPTKGGGCYDSHLNWTH